MVRPSPLWRATPAIREAATQRPSVRLAMPPTPASVYLSVLARAAPSPRSVTWPTRCTHGRSLVRWMAMRTHAVSSSRVRTSRWCRPAVSTPLAETLRRAPYQPAATQRQRAAPSTPDITRWIADLEDGVEPCARAGAVVPGGAQLASDEPGPDDAPSCPHAPSDRPQNVTHIPADAHERRRFASFEAPPTGAWTSRHHRWGADLAMVGARPYRSIDPGAGATGPRSAAGCSGSDRRRSTDLQWWTGWNKTTTPSRPPSRTLEDRGDRPATASPGIILASSGEDDHFPRRRGATGRPATLLPRPGTPTADGMEGQRLVFFRDRSRVTSTTRAGNIGPTLWWDGEIIGSWGYHPPAGEIMTKAHRRPRSRGLTAPSTTRQTQLHARLDGTVRHGPAVRHTPSNHALRGPVAVSERILSAITKTSPPRERRRSTPPPRQNARLPRRPHRSSSGCWTSIRGAL